MATIGHPLSDVCNFLTQFYLAKNPVAAVHGSVDGFLPGRTPGMPQPDQILQWYTAASGYDPRSSINWGMSFNLFKLAGVIQGIAARYAVRQASSAKAKDHAAARGPLAEYAWKLASDTTKDGPKL